MLDKQTPQAKATETSPTDSQTPAGTNSAYLTALVRRVVTDKKNSTLFRRVVSWVPDWISPTVVTIFRTVLIAPIIFACLGGSFAAALILFVVSMLLDALDGAMAQVRDQRTVLGAVLDPISDKIVVCGTLLALLPALPGVFAWPVGIIGALAVGITVARFAKMKAPAQARHGAVAARFIGKSKAVVETLAIGLLLLGLAASSPAIVWIGGVCLLVALGLAALSFRSQLKKK